MARFFWFVNLVAFVAGSASAAQETNSATALAEAIMTSVADHFATVRAARPILVDTVTFSRTIEPAVGGQVDSRRVVSAAGERARATDSVDAIVCRATPLGKSCWIADDGLYVAVKSVRVVGPAVAALVQYRFTIHIGPNRDFPYLAFVELRVTLQQCGSDWRVISREVARRS